MWKGLLLFILVTHVTQIIIRINCILKKSMLIFEIMNKQLLKIYIAALKVSFNQLQKFAE